MKIKYLKIKNFLSVGDSPIEIDFTKFGDIVNIKGENLDMGEDASNGSGKTTIIQSIVYGLYGKLLKGLNHREVVNVKSKKGLEVEVHVDDWRIVRKRMPDELQLWNKDSDKPESLGGMPATQQYIVDNVLKLNYQAFVNIVCFGQHMNHSFLTAEPVDKRAIAESLLSLDKYGRFCKTAKDKLKVLQSKREQLSLLYDKDLMVLDNAEKQLANVLLQREQWLERRDRQIIKTEDMLKRSKSEFDGLDDAPLLASYNIAQKELKHISTSIAETEEKLEKVQEIKSKIEERIVATKEDRHGIVLLLKDDEFGISKIVKQLDDLDEQLKSLVSQKGARCSACYGLVGEENCSHLLAHNKSRIVDLKENKDEAEAIMDAHRVKLSQHDQQIEALIKKFQEAKDKERTCSQRLKEFGTRKIELMAVPAPQASSKALLLEKEIAHLEEQIAALRGEIDPYEGIADSLRDDIEFAKENVEARRAEIKLVEEETPYIDFWIRGFGDQGIRSFVLKEIMPVLNARINYWLQFLVDNKIQINFNTELEESIERYPPDGDQFVYHAMSGGEHRRVDLAISQAFAHVMMLTSGTCPSIVCLDEVGTNLDRPGIQAVYRMICELARERQVFVTTHDPDLLDMLSGYDTILVRKENGFSKLVNNE